MSDSNVASHQQTPAELNALIEPPLSGNGHAAPVLEQHGEPLDPFAWFYILALPLSQFLQDCALVRHPTSGNGHETDQYLGDNSTHPHLSFRVASQDLIQFLGYDAFAEQPSFAGENDTPSYSGSWLIPAASLYQFLQPYALPGSEPQPPGNGHEISVEQNGTSDYAPLLSIPAVSLIQFLQLHEIPESRSSGSGNETPAEHHLDDGSEDDAISVSVTPTQFQDSDQVNETNGARSSIFRGCPVCQDTFHRLQERNRHVESYLPHSICCPLQGCCWTGRRQSDFNKHMKKKHSETDQVPIELYDPREFVKKILDERPVHEVARSAFTKIQEGLGRLGKPDVAARVLGRSRELRMWILSGFA